MQPLMKQIRESCKIIENLKSQEADEKRILNIKKAVLHLSYLSLAQDTITRVEQVEQMEGRKEQFSFFQNNENISKHVTL